MATVCILQDNLQLFLNLLATSIDYAIDDGDQDAIRFGIQDTDEAQNIWYDYPLFGNPPVYLGFARTNCLSRLVIHWETEADTGAKIEALMLILQRYHSQRGTDV